MFKRKLCIADADICICIIIIERLITFEHSSDEYLRGLGGINLGIIINGVKCEIIIRGLEIHLPQSCDRCTEIGRIALDTFPIHINCPNH